MTFSLGPFMENIGTYGTALSSKYDVTIAVPKAMQDKASDSNYAYINAFTNIMPFRAISCTTPGVAFMMNETNKWGVGPRIKQPYNVGFAEINLTFLADTDAVIESFCNLWMNLAFNYSYSSTSQANFLTSFRRNIISPTVQINKYDRTGALFTTYILTDVMPTLFVSSPLSWDTTDELSKFTLKLSYTSFDIK